MIDGTFARHYARLEAPCGHRIWDGSGGFDYPSVVRLRGTVAGREVDRLLFGTNPKYFLCEDDGGTDICCGGRPDRAVVTASDLDVYGPGACAYDPDSTNGVLFTRRRFSLGEMVWAIHQTGIHP